VEPEGISIDTAGNLYVADSQNNRVLRYSTPLATDTSADQVFGQRVCLHRMQPGRGDRNHAVRTSGVAVDAGGNLFVADLRTNRLLKYVLP
jgi:sugar lactone lactonase YvrE